MAKVNFIRNYARKNLMKATDEGIMVIPNTQKVDFQEAMLRQLLIENGINPNAIRSDGAMNEAMAFINQSTAAKVKTITNDNVIDITDKMPSPFDNIKEATDKGDFRGIANQVLKDPDIAREFALMKKFPTRTAEGEEAIPLAMRAKFDEEMGIKSVAPRDYSVEKLISDFKKFGKATDKDIQIIMKSGKMGQIPYVMDNYGMSYTEVLDTLKRGDNLIEGMGKEITPKNLKDELMKTDNPFSDLVKTTEKGPKSLDERRKEAEEILKKDNVTPIKDPDKKAEGGRAGFAQGLGPRFLKFLSENSPLEAAKKYNKSVKERMQAGKELEVASEVIPIAASGALVTNQLKKMLKNMNMEQKKEQQDKMFKEFSQEYKEKYKDSPELLEKMLLDLHKNIYMEEKADGGRIGYKDGPKLDIQAAGSKSGKQQIKGAPEGITMDSDW